LVLVLFGVVDDDGVVIATYLEGVFKDREFKSLEEIRAATVEAGLKRIRPLRRHATDGDSIGRRHGSELDNAIYCSLRLLLDRRMEMEASDQQKGMIALF
jgi:hypothetical protein